MANEPTPVRASVSVPANVPMERMIASVSEQNDPRLQDGEVTNLYNNLVNQREHSPTRPAPPPASPSYTGINDEEDQWVRTHPGWCEGHPLMYETRVRSMSFGPWSFIKKPIDILCCLPPPARRAPIREPWSAANILLLEMGTLNCKWFLLKSTKIYILRSIVVKSRLQHFYYSFLVVW